MKNVKAFTLAEVLVTLMIIGVIAAITIPTLNQNIKNKQFVSGCLKANSVLSQAVSRMKLEYGPIGFGSKWNNEEEFWKGFSAQLNVLENCGKGKGCYVNEMYKKLNGANEDNFYSKTTDYKLRTSDGMIINYSTLKYFEDKGISAEDVKNAIGRFYVDVNGDKGPNKIGLDSFMFILVKGKGLVPAGSFDTSSCTYAESGYSCAAKVIREKKIDYPKK